MPWIAIVALLAWLGDPIPVRAQASADVTARIAATSAVLRRHLDLLGASEPATRLAAFHEMARSGDPALIEAATVTALASDDAALRALALRSAFIQVRSLIARLEPPVPATPESRAVIEACGSATNYKIEKYAYESATFEVRGQDQAGVGNVSGSSLSMTLEYGCSFSGRLDRDGALVGVVSAPYKKGALTARIILR